MISFGIEWDIRCGDLALRVGDPLYLLRFTTAEHSNAIELIEQKPSQALMAQLRQVRDITSFRRGTFSLFDLAADRRKGINLIDDVKDAP